MSDNGWIPEDTYHQIKSLMPIPCVDLLIIHDKQLLLMLRNNEPGKGLWFTPGGRVKLGETLEKAVYRILEKETQLKPLKIEQKGAMSHMWPTLHAITTFYRVDVSSRQVILNDEHRDLMWVTTNPEDAHPYIKSMIEDSEVLSEPKEDYPPTQPRKKK